MLCASNMGLYVQMLNPSKIHTPKSLPIDSSFHALSSFSSPSSISFRPRKFSAIRSLNQSESQQHLSVTEAMLNSNRKEEVLGDIRRSLSNCLSETNLHLTVPGLHSKTRGKVNCWWTCFGDFENEIYKEMKGEFGFLYVGRLEIFMTVESFWF